jgi:hypothetical protein
MREICMSGLTRGEGATPPLLHRESLPGAQERMGSMRAAAPMKMPIAEDAVVAEVRREKPRRLSLYFVVSAP